MCALNALPRLNLPDAVFLKRFAAPRWLFILGMFLRSFVFLRRLRSFRSGLLRQDRVHLVAFLARHRFRHRLVRQVVDQPLEDAAPDLGMRHFTAAEEDRRLDLVAVREEALDVLLLELVVVLVDLRAELDFLDLDDLLVLLRRPRALLLLVLIAPEVHDAAEGRDRGRRDLDEVEPFPPRDGHRVRRWHDPELCAVLVDDANFTDPDAFVDPRAIVATRTAVKSYNNLLLNLRRPILLRVHPWRRFRPAPGRRIPPRCARRGRRRCGSARTRSPRRLRDPPSPACRES